MEEESGLNPVADLKANDPVRIRNNEDREFRVRWRRELYVLEPNKEVFWPWSVACQLLGDPTVQNTPQQPTANEVRLAAIRKLSNDNRFALELPKWHEWEAVKPSIETFTMAGERIHMAFETEHNRETYATGFSANDMKVRIAQLEAKLANLKASEDHELPFVVTENEQHAPGEAPTSETELPIDGGKDGSPLRKNAKSGS